MFLSASRDKVASAGICSLKELEGCVRRFALGTRAPQVSGVKVVRSAATGGADADDVALDVEFVWGGNPVRLCNFMQHQPLPCCPLCPHSGVYAPLAYFLAQRHLCLRGDSMVHGG